MNQLVLLFIFIFMVGTESNSPDEIIFSYECQQNKCIKVLLTEQNFNNSFSMPICKLFCGNTIGTLWPKPTGRIQIKKDFVQLDLNKIKFLKTQDFHLWDLNEKRFLKQIEAKVPNLQLLKGGRSLSVKIAVDCKEDKLNSLKLTLSTDESYKLEVNSIYDKITVNIEANSFFGARHGVETLSQLIVYDNLRRELQIVAQAEILDAPIYKYRGLLLDTARNWYSIDAIKRTIDAMAMVKMNTFHWHITDSQSFPLEIKTYPDMHKIGAYSSNKVYTHEAISEVVEFARARGVRVMPEFDAPAHVGEGWQNFNMTVCFNVQPWNEFCVEPPCGQLDPTIDGLYDVLEEIYREIFNLFDPDIFHMGGDEVSLDCWNSSERIKNWMHIKGWEPIKDNYIKLWNYFQEKALNRVDIVSKKSKIPIILWTSRLTDEPYIDEIENKERYIIQIWTESNNEKIKQILKRGFQVIVSNYDALYLDCGGPSWVSSGNNWCSPYSGWQKIYENSPSVIAGEYVSLVLGAEAAVWSEQIGEPTLDFRLWPRVSALAERLWSNPTEGWQEAESRMLLHRERLFENDIRADVLQPEWCVQNEKECPINDSKNLS